MNAAAFEKPSRQTIGPVIDALAATGDPMVANFLEAWGAKQVGQRKADKTFFLLTPKGEGFALTDLTGPAAGSIPEGVNLARRLVPGGDLNEAEACDLLVSAEMAPSR